MEGLFLSRNNKYIEKVEQKYSNLALIAKGGESEVMVQKIQKGQLFCLEPMDKEDFMDFFYILKGCVQCNKNGEEILLKKGEFFYASGLKEVVDFKTIEDTELLYVCSNPIFKYLSNRMKETTEMIRKVEKKDVYTFNHGERVKNYSLKIGKKLGMSKEKIEILGFAALCHDVGKINVPDKILNKPGRLTDEEFDYIKKHPEDGEKIVEGGFLDKTKKIIRQHHERLDGSGYPEGIKGDSILLEARIIAVADTYDAMTTDRAYRKGLDVSVAINELRRLSGIHYDPKIVKIFEEILREDGKFE